MNSATVREALDNNGCILAEGDRVRSATAHHGETGFVTRAAGGQLISIRLDSSGRNLTSDARLWAKLES
jgi:hypothetical protein